jgi:hypothetical protein
MRKVIALVFSVAFFPSFATADPVGGSGGSNDTKPHTDFEITITSDVDITVDASKLKINGTSIGGAQVVNNGSQDVTLTWTHDIPANAIVEWSYTGTEPRFNQWKHMPRYTPSDAPTDLPGLGFDVTSGKVFLTNGYSAAIDFSNLLFQFPASAFTADSLIALLGSSTGIAGLVTHGTVPGNGELLVADFPSLPSGLLTGTYDSSFDDSSFSPLTLEGVDAHGVPEPSTWVMMLIGAAGVMFAGYRCARITVSAV